MIGEVVGALVFVAVMQVVTLWAVFRLSHDVSWLKACGLPWLNSISNAVNPGNK